VASRQKFKDLKMTVTCINYPSKWESVRLCKWATATWSPATLQCNQVAVAWLFIHFGMSQ